MASNKVSMPMSSAGIIGSSPDVQTSGRALDPKFVVAAVVILVLVVQIANLL